MGELQKGEHIDGKLLACVAKRCNQSRDLLFLTVLSTGDIKCVHVHVHVAWLVCDTYWRLGM